MVFFHLLAGIILKNKCQIDIMDLESGFINVTGKTEMSEENCYNDLERYLVDYISELMR
jgi:hypothetical protein